MWRRASKYEKDPMLDASYFTEKNNRMNKHPSVYKNYQINPYTKKTLDFTTPKITTRQAPLDLTVEQTKANHDLIQKAVYKSLDKPMEKYNHAQTELMRIGWHNKTEWKGTPKGYLECVVPWSQSPCVYYYPSHEGGEDDSRFRASHKTSEFIKTMIKLRAYDSVMKSLNKR